MCVVCQYVLCMYVCVNMYVYEHMLSVLLLYKHMFIVYACMYMHSVSCCLCVAL